MVSDPWPKGACLGPRSHLHRQSNLFHLNHHQHPSLPGDVTWGAGLEQVQMPLPRLGRATRSFLLYPQVLHLHTAPDNEGWQVSPGPWLHNGYPRPLWPLREGSKTYPSPTGGGKQHCCWLWRDHCRGYRRDCDIYCSENAIKDSCKL